MTLGQIHASTVRSDDGETISSDEASSLAAALAELISFRGLDWEAPDLLDLDAELAAARAGQSR